MKKHLLPFVCAFLSALPLLTPQAQARPNFKNLRYEENWLELKSPSANPEFWDSLKYIPFSEEGQIYLSLGGSWRIRAEGWSGYDFKPDQNAIFALNQLRLHADFHATDFFRLYIEGLSALGTPRNLPGGIANNLPTGLRGIDLDSLDLQNAFLDLKYAWAPDSFVLLRPGRQEMDLGKQRLISSLVWVNTRRTFDAVSLITQSHGWNLRGLYAQLVKTQPWSFNLSDPGSSVYGLYATGPLPFENWNSDLYWLGLHKGKTSYQAIEAQEDRQTLGLRLNGKLPWGFELDTEGAYQLGSFGDQVISAGFAAFDLGYKVDLPWKPRLGLALDYASGDGSSSDKSLNTFNQLFPLGHAYYGYADQIGRQNALGLKASLSAQPLPELSLALDGHAFWRASTQDDVYGVAGNVTRKAATGSDAYLGFEADLIATWKWDAHFQTQAGLSLFLPGSFYSQGGTSALMTFGYLQSQYSF
ncbi:MAG: alginate export family protein [Candidatus Sericytochromatia bacterium]